MEIGVDIVTISRFKNVSEHFISRILTKEELVLFSNEEDSKKATFLAKAWATKEAIFKATQDKNYLQYALLKDKFNKPYILNHDEIKVSLAHENDILIAFVIKM